MTIQESIKNRSSIFPAQFEKGNITKEDIKSLLEAANRAPSHKHTEPWRFKVFLQASAKENLGNAMVEAYHEHTPEGKASEFQAKKIREKTEQSAAILAICMQRDPKESLPEWEEVAAVAMAVQNIWLSLASLKLGGYWSSPGFMQHMDSFLKLNTGERCMGFLYLGRYSGERMPSKKGELEDKIVWF